jgi:hypothetical protein
VFVGIECDSIGSSGFTTIGELGSKCSANSRRVWFIWGTLVDGWAQPYVNQYICVCVCVKDEDQKEMI